MSSTSPGRDSQNIIEIAYDSVDKIFYVPDQHALLLPDSIDDDLDKSPFKFESYLDDIIQTVGWY